MLRILRLLAGALGGHLALTREHAKARAVHLGLLAFAGLTAFVFLMVLLTYLLALWLGTGPALAIMLVLWLLVCLAAVAMMRAEQRRYEALQRQRRTEDRRVAQTALIAAIPMLKRSGVAAAALGGLALVAWLRGRRRD